MTRTKTNVQAALCLLGSALIGSCHNEPSAPKFITQLVVGKVAADLSTPDPSAEYWRNVPDGPVLLTAQPMVAPRPETTTTGSVMVQAVHDGKRVAFRLRWKDTEKSEAGHLGEFSDALALEFPVKEGSPPLVMMGSKDNPVHLFHWRAQYQRDHEKGKPSMKDLYPNSSIDIYPMEFKDLPAAKEAATDQFAPGRAEGNPQAYVKASIDEIIAEGYSTSSVQEGHGSAAKGEWKNGEWTLVIVRPLAIEGGSTLHVGGSDNIAFAVWQGGKGEVGSRKCVTMAWTPMKIQ